jgi:hypothetical protein
MLALEGDQGAASLRSEVAVDGHAPAVGGQPLLDGGHRPAALTGLDRQHPADPAAGRVAMPSSPGRQIEAIRSGARRLGASTIRPAPRYMPTW